MYSPAEVARRYVETGKSKAALPAGRMLLLGMLAGAFIALAGGSATFAVSYGGRLAGAAVGLLWCCWRGANCLPATACW